jgi:hypothetical protein
LRYSTKNGKRAFSLPTSVMFSPRGAACAATAWSNGTMPSSAIRAITTLRRATAACSSFTGEYVSGAEIRPASMAASGKVS